MEVKTSAEVKAGTSFMDLPLELRHEVYYYSLNVEKPIRVLAVINIIDGWKLSDLPALARCSHAIRLEMVAAYIQCNTIDFHYCRRNDEEFARIAKKEGITLDFYQNIRSMSVHTEVSVWDGLWEEHEGDYLLGELKYVERCRHLQHLRIDCEPWMPDSPCDSEYGGYLFFTAPRWPRNVPFFSPSGRSAWINKFVGKLQHNKQLRKLTLKLSRAGTGHYHYGPKQKGWVEGFAQCLEEGLKEGLKAKAGDLPWMSKMVVGIELEKGRGSGRRAL